MSNFATYSRYYDLLYAGKDTSSEVDYVESCLQRFGVAGRTILEVGCGSGRHGRLFRDRGWQWQGVERSADMAGLARLKHLDVEVGAIEHTILDRQFDAAISLFHVISYVTENTALLAVFRNIRQMLLPGGLFLFDVWYSPAVYHLHPEPRTLTVEDDSYAVTRRATPKEDPNRNLVEVHYDIHLREKANGSEHHFSEVHPMRHFSLPELRLLAEVCGYEWLHAEEWLTAQVPGLSTWGVCCVLRKP